MYTKVKPTDGLPENQDEDIYAVTVPIHTNGKKITLKNFTGLEQTPKKNQHRKFTLENSPATPAGILTHNLFIVGQALCQLSCSNPYVISCFPCHKPPGKVSLYLDSDVPSTT